MRSVKQCLILAVMAALPLSAGESDAGSNREFRNGIGMMFRPIPAGEFLMGSGQSPEQLLRLYGKWKATPTSFSHLIPQHKVRITKSYYLGMYEVTVSQFRQFIEATGYRTEAEREDVGGVGCNSATGKPEWGKQYNWRSPGFPQTDQSPVVIVSWNDATAFCEWLSKREGKKYYLPTEAEWEHACRAGTTTAYCLGDDLEHLTEVGNVRDATYKLAYPDAQGTVVSRDGYAFTSPAGTLRANTWGLYDVHGNVFEWCADWYADNYYDNSPIDDPAGPAVGEMRSVRGGSWEGRCWFCMSAYRDALVPTDRNCALGFRVAMVHEQQSP